MSALLGRAKRPMVMVAAAAYSLILGAALLWFHYLPETVLLLTVGGIVVALLILRPLVGVHALILLLFLEYSEFLRGDVAGVTAMKAAGAVILAGWLLSMAIHRRTRLRFDPLFIAMGLFVIWCGCTALYALNQTIALTRFYTFIPLALTAMMVSSVVDSVNRMRGVYVAIVLWATLATIEAIGEYYAGRTRVVQGLLHDRNLLAAYINLAIIAAYILLLTVRQAVGRFLLVAVLPILFLGLFLTLSRAGLIVMFVAVLVVWYRMARERRFTLLLGSVALLCLISLILPEKFWKRAESIVPELQRQEDTFGLRVYLWKIGARMVADQPLTGVGAGNFVVAFPKYAQGRVVRRQLVAHNSYVSVAAEMGLIGLALFLSIHALAFRNIYHAIRLARTVKDRPLESMAVATEVCLLALMMGALAGSGEGMKCLWIVLGFSSSVAHMAGVKALEFQRASTGGNVAPPLPGVGTLGVAGISR